MNVDEGNDNPKGNKVNKSPRAVWLRSLHGHGNCESDCYGPLQDCHRKRP